MGTHPELLAFQVIDANRAATSQESLVRLATVCEKFAVQCRSIAQLRVAKMEDRSKKLEVKQMLLDEVDSVLPMLRQHVLKIGLSKTQLKDDSLSPQKRNAQAFGGNVSHKLTSLFTHEAVTDAHRAVEDCRERLMQELLFRRAKVERRLLREEEQEKEKEASRRLGNSSPGSRIRDATRLSEIEAYSGLLLADQAAQKEKLEARKRELLRADSKSIREASDSPTRSKSPRGLGGGSTTHSEAEEAEAKQSNKKDASPKRGRRKDDKGKSSSSPSPRSPRGASSPSPRPKAKGSAKAKSNSSADDSKEKGGSKAKSKTAKKPRKPSP